jgi:hypothetical protein
MYGLGVEVGVVLDSSTPTPTCHRMGSMTEATSDECVGIALHQIFPGACKIAFPKWDSARVPDAPSNADAEAADQIEVHRHLIRSKTWRMVKTLQSSLKREKFFRTCWVAEPLEHMGLRFQYLNERGDIILDLLNESTSPIDEARLAFCRMMTQDLPDGILKSFFWYHGTSERCLNDTRTLVLGMDAQVFWRFLDLSGYPIEICRMVDPASRLTQTPQDVADKVYEANECDVDEHLVGKARQLFPSAKAMAEDKDFLAMLRGFVRIATCDSMQIERLLSLITSAAATSDAKAPSAERVLSTGLLTQFRKEHIGSLLAQMLE